MRYGPMASGTGPVGSAPASPSTDLRARASRARTSARHRGRGPSSTGPRLRQGRRRSGAGEFARLRTILQLGWAGLLSVQVPFSIVRFIDLRPLLRRDFRLLYAAQFVSFLGTMVTYVALPWQMYA